MMADLRLLMMIFRFNLFPVMIVGLVALWGGKINPCYGQTTLLGIPTVIDGDTLRLNGQSIRLFAIDAPELDQTCLINAVQWPCGQAASEALAEWVAGVSVLCEGVSIDRYNRLVAICWRSDGLELNQTLVRSGLAVANPFYSDRYVNDQEQARLSGVGLWASDFMLPWIWRKQHPK